MRHARFAAWLSSIPLLCASTAQAAPTARLVYARTPGAETCPDEDGLRRAVAARLGYDPFFAWAKKTIVARFSAAPATPAAHAFVASVSLVDEDGVDHGARDLRSDADCAELTDAAALAIAIALDPSLLARSTPPPPRAESPAPAPAPSPVPPSSGLFTPEAPLEPTPPPPAPAGARVRFAIALGAVASAGTSPKPTAGVGLGVEARWRRVSLGLEGRVDLPSTSQGAEGGVQSWLAEGALAPCVHAGVLMVCGLGEIGSLQIESDKVKASPSRPASWIAVGGRAGVEAPIGGRWLLRLRTDMVGNLQPQRVYLDGAVVWRTPSVATSLGVDAVLHFW